MKVRSRHVALAFSVVIYLASLTQPVYVCRFDKPSWLGYEVLMMGWLALAGLDPRWWANLALIFIWCWLLRLRQDFPMKSIIIVGLCALTAPFPSPIGCPGMDTPTSAVALTVGGYLWSASLLITALSALALRNQIVREEIDG
jgi:hypothetical protein